MITLLGATSMLEVWDDSGDKEAISKVARRGSGHLVKRRPEAASAVPRQNSIYTRIDIYETIIIIGSRRFGET